MIGNPFAGLGQKMSQAQSFIFGPGTQAPTYETLKKRREVAEMLAQQAMQTPQNVGEGIGAIGRALAYRYMDSKLGPQEDAERQRISDLLMGGGIGGAPGGFTGAGTSPTMSAMSASDGSPVSLIRQEMLSRGLPEHVAEGFLMNFEDESGFDPSINEVSPVVPGSRGGFGLAQWTGPRRVALEEFAQSTGRAVSDPKVQIEFLLSELSGPESAAAEQIMSTKTPGDAAAAIATHFLRPAPEHLERRVAQYTGGQGYQAPPQMDMGRMQALAEVIGNPYASPGQQVVAQALIQQLMAQPDPMAPLEMEKLQREISLMGQPDPMSEYQRQSLDLERQKMAQPQDDPTSVREYLFAQQQGETRPYSQWLADTKKAGATSVSVNNSPGESALQKKLGEKEGEQWASYMQKGGDAAANNQSFDVLSELVEMAPQGPIQGRLASAFPGISSAGAAFESLVMPIAPTLRVEGSGATSDIEYEGMLRAMPQLRNKPEANRLILGVLKAKNSINLARADIVRAYSDGEIDDTTARKRMAEINRQSIMTPEMKALISAAGGEKSGGAPEKSAVKKPDDADRDLFLKYGLEP